MLPVFYFLIYFSLCYFPIRVLLSVPFNPKRGFQDCSLDGIVNGGSQKNNTSKSFQTIKILLLKYCTFILRLATLYTTPATSLFTRLCLVFPSLDQHTDTFYVKKVLLVCLKTVLARLRYDDSLRIYIAPWGQVGF